MQKSRQKEPAVCNVENQTKIEPCFSNVVEKCVSNAMSEERAALIREVCQPEGGDRCRSSFTEYQQPNMQIYKIPNAT